MNSFIWVNFSFDENKKLAKVILSRLNDLSFVKCDMIKIILIVRKFSEFVKQKPGRYDKNVRSILVPKSLQFKKKFLLFMEKTNLSPNFLHFKL